MNAITTTRPHPLRPQNFGELVEFAKMAARSTLVPRDYLGKPENILLAIQMGSEIGLAPMQSLQNISVINGRPAVWGDAMLGLCRQSPVCKDVVERFEGEGKDADRDLHRQARGAEPIERRFSMDDAERAGLASKAGTWQQYPKRMLQMRARGFALRDAFPDVLRGLICAEEAEDIPEEKHTGPTLEASPEREAPQPPSSVVGKMMDNYDRGEAARRAERDVMNDAVPMKAVASDVKRAERIEDKSKVYDTSPTDADKWWFNLETKLATAQSQAEMMKIGELKSVKVARESPIPEVQERVMELLANAYARFPTDTKTWTRDLSDEALGEVAIAGEANVAAG